MGEAIGEVSLTVSEARAIVKIWEALGPMRNPYCGHEIQDDANATAWSTGYFASRDQLDLKIEHREHAALINMVAAARRRIASFEGKSSGG